MGEPIRFAALRHESDRYYRAVDPQRVRLAATRLA
jgi:hypothetical protein